MGRIAGDRERLHQTPGRFPLCSNQVGAIDYYGGVSRRIAASTASR